MVLSTSDMGVALFERSQNKILISGEEVERIDSRRSSFSIDVRIAFSDTSIPETALMGRSF